MTRLDLARRVRPPNESDFPSPLHSPRVASRVGLALGVAFTVCFVTGLLSHLVQHPTSWFSWPGRPVWLYALTQGLHVASGIVAIPLLGIKVWVVSPRFWRRPFLGIVSVLERGSIFVLVASATFELATGLLNVAEFYPWSFFFPPVHYAVAWIAMGALAVHIAVKLPVIRDALSSPVDRPDRVGDPDRAGAADRSAEVNSSAEPVRAGTLSRRSLLTVTAGAVGLVTLATIGDRIPALEKISVLSQRAGSGPQGLPVNRSAAAAGVRTAAVDPAWRLVVTGPGGSSSFSLADLRALPQTDVTLPIACVEGWSRSADWSGVRVGTLLSAAGAGAGDTIRFTSLDPGTYGRVEVPASVAADPLALVALGLAGAPLHIDHGFPARLIMPSRPGVQQTKWLRSVEVLA